MNYRPSSVLVRTAYSIALLLFALPIVVQIRYAKMLFTQMSTNPNIVNPVTATSLVLLFVVVSIVVLSRLWSIVSGKCKLDVAATNGGIYWLRVISLIFLLFGVFVFFATLLSRLLTGIGAIALIAGEFRMLMPAGLVLFEFSRLLEREKNEQEET